MPFNSYKKEELDGDDDNGTMPENVQELTNAVIGRKIVKVEKNVKRPHERSWWGGDLATVITLDDGKEVLLRDTNDCCAYTQLEEFLLHPEKVDHFISGVGTTEGYTKWHIYADMGDVLDLTVGWSSGNPFYYGYGFDISVIEPEPKHVAEQLV